VPLWDERGAGRGAERGLDAEALSDTRVGRRCEGGAVNTLVRLVRLLLLLLVGLLVGLLLLLRRLLVALFASTSRLLIR